MPIRPLAQHSLPSLLRPARALLTRYHPCWQHPSHPTALRRHGPARQLLYGASGVRGFHMSTVLLPPAVFTGLLGALWLFKCTMMVLFQNKIIYMPGMPPNARSERIEDYARQCGGIQWQQERTRTADGVDIALAVATVQMPEEQTHLKWALDSQAGAVHAYILYFQGNASSIPPRLPDLSGVMRMVRDSNIWRSRPFTRISCTMVCVSYRGYWTSKGRPSEEGLNQDAAAALQWISRLHDKTRDGQQCQEGTQLQVPASNSSPILLLWGQSIGCGIATSLAATFDAAATKMFVNGIVLETPFLSTRAMLEALYPQRWVPYKHLWPFLWNHLDSWGNIKAIAAASKSRGQAPPSILIVAAGSDELVPAEHSDKLLRRCRDLGLPAEKRAVQRAYHNEAVVRAEGKRAVSDFIVNQIDKALLKEKQE